MRGRSIIAGSRSRCSAHKVSQSPHGVDHDKPPTSLHSNRKDQKKKKPSSVVMTPSQILYSDAWPEKDTVLHEDEVSLHHAIRVMKQALHVLSQDEVSPSLSRFLPTLPSSEIKIIRIEQVLSKVSSTDYSLGDSESAASTGMSGNGGGGAVDPLCWLRAALRNVQETDPLFYLATDKGDENRVETACIGSAKVLHDREELWKLVPRLPPRTNLYGGERFDNRSNSTNTATPVSDEWKPFGSAFWMLPAVELRQERHKGAHGGAPADVGDLANQSFSATWTTTTTTLAVHLYLPESCPDLRGSVSSTLKLLSRLTDRKSAAAAPTTLPPVLYRDSSTPTQQDGQEIYEQAVAHALQELEQERLEKVVLARQQRIHFGRAAHGWTALDVVRRWKYGGHEGGHLFWMRPPAGSTATVSSAASPLPEFFGCTPERLFSIHGTQDGGGTAVRSEALAGTRPRGSTQQADDELLQELFNSPKDQLENLVTCKYIESAFQGLEELGWVQNAHNTNDRSDDDSKKDVFVRRLRHLQHICHRYLAHLTNDGDIMNVARYLLSRLHPTPAVCGVPLGKALDLIREHESIGFDRGFYSGPIGYIGRDSADIFVAIRSALLTRSREERTTTVSVFAGAGIVPGSTLQGEWAETNYKMEVVSSLFPQSPFTLQNAATPNVAFAAAFVEELIRNGVTRFYVCPGSRSTPLVVALAKAVRSHVGVVQATSVHDERSAAFRALGYARGAGRPAAVVTSSGTAVTNLYPGIVEAGMDAVPLLLLTADRPYESRHTGANQAIDQVKAFSSTYVRWFRDILPPDDAVPLSVALSDAGHAVSLSKELRGPVHVNIQFRENLAPDAGQIRNDKRVDSVSNFNANRFIDAAGFKRWSTGGDRWTRSFVRLGSSIDPEDLRQITRLIAESRRGIIVVGNLRGSANAEHSEDQFHISQAISDFAQTTGFPIFAGAQSAGLRFTSSAVIPFAEHLLKCSLVRENLKPDFVLQIGAPLVSTEIPSAIEFAMKQSEDSVYHVLLHPHHPQERVDPSFTVTHRVSAEVAPFLRSVQAELSGSGFSQTRCSSGLAPLVLLGREVQREMPSIIHEASVTFAGESEVSLTEPQIALALSEYFSTMSQDQSLFLSNSMPVRDAEFFLYPLLDGERRTTEYRRGPRSVGTNRGASGIDGIIASAAGFAEAMETPTTLLIGDLATLHDINSWHSLATDSKVSNSGSNKRHPLTTVVVNNDGGAIFSFLPIAKHGSDVGFDEFFGTPTSTFSFEAGSKAFGLPITQASDFGSFQAAYRKSQLSGQNSVIEARVAGREANVAVHRRITESVESFVEGMLTGNSGPARPERLPVKVYGSNTPNGAASKTLVLLHGWMGDKAEWDDVATPLLKLLPSNWQLLSLDLPAHGAAALRDSSLLETLRSCLRLSYPPYSGKSLSVDSMAELVLATLLDFGIKRIDALAGYSLGGRVALAMKRLCISGPAATQKPLEGDSKLVLLSAYPGELDGDNKSIKNSASDHARLTKDDQLAADIVSLCDKSCVLPSSGLHKRMLWDDFIEKWYGSPMWGNLSENDSRYRDLKSRRVHSLNLRGRDIAAALSGCTPPRNSKSDWQFCCRENTLFMAGGLDRKYTAIGETLRRSKVIAFEEARGAGHALLVDAPARVAQVMGEFLLKEQLCSDETSQLESIPSKTSTRPPLSRNDLPQQSDVRTRNKALRSTPNTSNIVGSASTINNQVSVKSLDFKPFSIDLVDPQRKVKSIFGIGWRNAAARATNRRTRRSGFIVEILSEDETDIGIGEVSPLTGLHEESLDEAKQQLTALQAYFSCDDHQVKLNANALLALDGRVGEFLNDLADRSGIGDFLPSVKSGFEMAMLSLASHRFGLPVHDALTSGSTGSPSMRNSPTLLPLNGLITRGSPPRATEASGKRCYESFKVKVGHQHPDDDAASIAQAFQRTELFGGYGTGKIRVDANRAWDISDAIEFSSALDGYGLHAVDRIEFVEEPLTKQINSDGQWTLEDQVQARELWYRETGIRYALDETVADLVARYSGQIEPIRDDLVTAFSEGDRGCVALVLKPALLGLELSAQLGRLAKEELGIGAVISSSFDSGVGLAFASFLGAYVDAIPSSAPMFSHGAGTFELLEGDTLWPPFESYVNDHGKVNVRSLSRALFGLGLEEMSISFGDERASKMQVSPEKSGRTKQTTYEASSAPGSSGRDVSVIVSLPLPFSADTACSRFTDLPQQSRWCPWIHSVSYQGQETEWTLNVRGVPVRWRATSEVLSDPPGIQWESVSGLTNRGVVQFVPDSKTTCHMKVQMTIELPRVLRPVFGTSVVAEDFLREKLLKWSLEMFRDVVKADLALERGDVELGDALFGAVEGKASAIEATLNIPQSINGDRTDTEN